MNILQELLDVLKGAEKAAFKLGKSTGDAGKPSLIKSQVEKSFGPNTWAAYTDGYNEGKNRYKPKTLDEHCGCEGEEEEEVPPPKRSRRLMKKKIK